MPAQRNLVDEIVQIIEINRATINRVGYGQIVLKVYEGRLVEVTASESLRLSRGMHLCPLTLKSEVDIQSK